MSISDNVRQRMMAGAWIRKMFEEGNALKQRFGEENVFDLSLGNPIMEPPPEFVEELKRLAEKPLPGMHRYMENAGHAETRAAVAAQLSQETGVTFTMNDIVMTCGAAGGLNVTLKAILNPQEEVIVFAPFFAEFDNYIDNHGGVVRVLPTDEKFIPRLDELDAAITAKTPESSIYQVPIERLVTLQTKIITAHPSLTRILYTIKEMSEKKPYVISLRAIQTNNFLTAEVSPIPWVTLSKIAEKILEKCPKVSSVYYDVTPKPPATIEME